MHFHPRNNKVIVLVDAQRLYAHASTDGSNGNGSQHGSTAVALYDAKLDEYDERPKSVHANDDGEPDAVERNGDESPTAADDAKYDDEHEPSHDAGHARKPTILELTFKGQLERLAETIFG
jgi:hypothetical protein